MASWSLSPTRRSEPRPAGRHTRESVRRLRLHCLVVLGFFAVVTDVLGTLVSFHGLTFQLSELLLLAVCFAVLRWVLPIVDRRDRGASAEEQVGAILDTLCEDGWHVIHDARLGMGNVDHIVIGPAGVFTVETKSNPGPIQVQRLHGGIIRQAHTQRDRVARLTEDGVEPLVVFSRAWVDHPGRRRKGVRVVPARLLRDYLLKRPARLSPDQVEDVHRRLESALVA